MCRRNFNSTLAMAHVAKHAEPVTIGKEIANIMRRAFSLLRNGRGSPVIIELPADAYAEDAPDPLNYEPVVVTKYGTDPAAVAEAAKVLVAAKRPVIYAGTGRALGRGLCRAEGAGRAAGHSRSAPASEARAPFDETHPLSLGSGGLAIPQTVRSFLDSPT